MIGSLATCADLVESIQAEDESVSQVVFKDVLEAIGDITSIVLAGRARRRRLYAMPLSMAPTS